MNSHADTVKLLSNTLHVDDFAGGALNIEDGFQRYQQAKKVMKEGGLNLRKWRTNDESLQQRIDEAEELRKGSETEETRECPIKILRLSWDTCEDCFCFEFEQVCGFAAPTKGYLLQVSAKVFDPLGFLSPCTASAKIMFQQLRMLG